jgi:hypothetical protein
MAFPGAIWIDQTAAGYGWYLNPSPAADGLFPAAPGSGAFGKVDLLTVVEHELGHELGLADTTGDGLMGEYLPTGVRRAPALDSVLGPSAGQGLVAAPLPQPPAPLPGGELALGPDAMTAPLGTSFDSTWAAAAALSGELSSQAPPLASAAPVLAPVEWSSGAVAAAPGGQCETPPLWALDTLFASSEDPLVSGPGEPASGR